MFQNILHKIEELNMIFNGHRQFLVHELLTLFLSVFFMNIDLEIKLL